jgi:hypothetical protein
MLCGSVKLGISSFRITNLQILEMLIHPMLQKSGFMCGMVETISSLPPFFSTIEHCVRNNCFALLYVVGRARIRQTNHHMAVTENLKI